MTQIDRYVLFLYLRVLLICFLSLSGLLIVVHVFTNLDEFVEYGKTRGGILLGIVEYFGPYLLNIFDRTSGILALMSSMFVVAWLYRTNELTALLAAGISKGRVMRPIVFATLGLLVLAAVNRELGIPRFAESLGKNPKDLKGKAEKTMRPVYDEERACLIGGRLIYMTTREIVEPVFRLEGHSSAISNQVTGKLAKFQFASEGKPQGFLVEEVRNPNNIDLKDSVYVDGVPFVLTPKDTPWLAPNQCFITATIHFELLEGGSNWKQFSSTASLIYRLQSSPRYYGDDIRATVHARFLRPLFDLALFLFGLPIVLGRQEGHLFRVASASIGVIAGYLAILVGSQAIGSSGTFLSPAMAAWVPVVLILPIAWVRSKNAMQS